MHPSASRRTRACLPLLFAVAAAITASMPAAAQDNCTDLPCGPIDAVLPEITIDPASGTHPAGAQSVTIYWSDNLALNHDSHVITFDSANVTGAFSYTPINGWTGQATGTVSVTTGSKVLTAYICDRSAQGPNCQTASVTYTGAAPPQSAVRVSGDTATLRLPEGTYAVARYRVVNTGTASTWYAISMGCGGGLWQCSSSTDSVTVAAGDSAWVDAYFATGAAGVSTTVSLTASAGGVSAMAARGVVVAAAPASGFVGDGPSMERIQRDDCVTVSAGPAAASECGDLRLVHGLPGVRVLNKPRQPVLTYNSTHARPFPTVAEHLAGPAARPDSIRAVLMLGTTRVAAGAWPGWAPGQVRRIAVGFEASSYLTGVYPYTLVVTAKYAGGAQETLVNRPGRMIIVNRSGSPFGAGWWLSGVEQLVDLPGDTVKLWVGGDGSARLYRRTGAARWRADDYDRPDSLYQTYSGVMGQNVIVRRLPGSAEVWFSASGIHLATATAVGHLTRFRWSSAPVGTTTEMRLDSLMLPSPTGQPDVMRYLFEYGTLMPGCVASTTGLTRVHSPAPAGGYRETRLCGDALRRVTRITDPDSSAVNFLYSASSRWITRRTDRRGGVTTFDFQRGRFNTWIRVLNPTQSAIARVHAVQSLGMNGVSVLQDSVYVRFDGPRPYAEVCDCVEWTVNRWGAPTLTRDPFGAVTQIRREDSRWPGRVTSAYAPSGFGQVAIYDARANLSATIDANPYGDGRNASTTYEWDARWNAPTRIVSPEGEVALAAYDQYGRRRWEQVGAISVSYDYYAVNDPVAPALALSVIPTGGGADVFEYDARGNLSATVSPRGARSEFRSDRLGRVVASRTVIDTAAGVLRFQHDSTQYHALNDRVQRVESFGPAMNGVDSQRVVVENSYDKQGNLEAVSRASSPDPYNVDTVTTRWEHDSAGRTILEIAPDATPANPDDNPSDSTVYDLAGNVVEVHTRRWDDAGQRVVVRMDYDAANRRQRAYQDNFRIDTLYFDRGGNQLFGTTVATGFSAAPLRDAAYFYGADGKLAAADVRNIADDKEQESFYTRSFEEYRYDGLGRRVLVRLRRDCAQFSHTALCEIGFVRRTVWDGDRELYEIQAWGGWRGVEGGWMEADTARPRQSPMNGDPLDTLVDPNPFLGRVAYTHGLSLDQPLSVVRMGYTSRLDSLKRTGTTRDFDPVAIVPLWNSRGQPAFGAFADGTWRKCMADAHCIDLAWPEMWAGYARPEGRRMFWHGTLLEDKGDGSGLNYRRNRYYDPVNGRFTQEDPIGLAGGLNVYGFAAGDPVTYSDPYGLCKRDEEGREDSECRAIVDLLQMTARVADLSEFAQAELLYAANVYERFQGDVKFIDAPESLSGGSSSYFVGATSFDQTSSVRLNTAASGIDLALVAYHEAQHLSVGRGLRHDGGRQPGDSDSTDRMQAMVYNWLPRWLQDQARETRRYLQEWGIIK